MHPRVDPDPDGERRQVHLLELFVQLNKSLALSAVQVPPKLESHMCLRGASDVSQASSNYSVLVLQRKRNSPSQIRLANEIRPSAPSVGEAGIFRDPSSNYLNAPWPPR